jgi:hypothetical protein
MYMTRRIATFLLSLHLASDALHATSESFEAEGHLVRQAWENYGAKLRREETYTFRVQYRHPYWSILTRNTSHGLRDAEFTFDGTNQIVCVFRAPAEFTTPITTNTFVGHAEVRREAMPHCRIRPVNSVLWLALCSRSYFESHSNLSEPLFVTDSLGADMDDLYRTPIEYPCIVRWNRNFPHAPASIEFHNDGTIYGWDYEGQSMKQPPKSYRLPEPFDKGYLQARLVIDSTGTNADAVEPWKTARYEQFGRMPKTASEGHSTFLLERHTLTITNFASTCQRTVFQPSLTGQVMVSECRFETASQPIYKFQYATRNWLDDDHVKKLPEYIDQLALQPLVVADIENRRPKEDGRHSHKHTLGILGVLSAGLTVIVLLLIFRNKQSSLT